MAKEADSEAPFFGLPNGNNGLDLKHNYVYSDKSKGHPSGTNPDANKYVIPEAMEVLFK